jgi:putative membrane protein
MTAAKGGMMEVHMGQMAEKQGQSSDVKKLGSKMVADHTKVNTQLMSLAQTKGVKLDTRHKMSQLDSANFDQAWLDQMVKDHQKTIAAFQTETKSGTDADVKSFANKTLPALQKHLQMVQSAQAKVGKASSSTSPAKKS